MRWEVAGLGLASADAIWHCAGMETFESVHLQLEVRGLARDVEVDGDLLKIFWSAFEGPQTAAELAEANRALFVRLIEDKIDRREVRADERELRLLSTDWTG